MTYSIKLEPGEKDDTWFLTEPFTYNDITVPEGFETDLASIPYGFQWIIPKGGPMTVAAVVHNYLYRTREKSRKEADDIFLKILEELGVSFWKRFTMYLGVRSFGQAAYSG